MKFKKHIITILLFSQLILMHIPLATSAAVIPLVTDSSDTLAPYVDEIDWQYKVIDGVFCRRLYNYTTLTPLSDWEPVP